MLETCGLLGCNQAPLNSLRELLRRPGWNLFLGGGDGGRTGSRSMVQEANVKIAVDLGSDLQWGRSIVVCL